MHPMKAQAVEEVFNLGLDRGKAEDPLLTV